MFKKIIILFLPFLSWELYAGDCINNVCTLFQCSSSEQEQNRSCNLVESAVIPFNKMVHPYCKDFLEDLSKEERERNLFCNWTDEKNLFFCSCLPNCIVLPIVINTGSWVVLPPYFLFIGYAVAQDCKNIEEKYKENDFEDKSRRTVVTAKKHHYVG